MSHVGNAIKMLIILKSRGLTKIRELAEELEVNERTVRRYKNDLLQAMVYIDSKGGKDGGYRLNDTYHSILGLNITDEDYLSLLMAQAYLEESLHVCSKDFKLFMHKINNVYKNMNEGFNDVFSATYAVKSFPGNANSGVERKKLIDIQAAIITKKKVTISYTSINTGSSERIVRPYGVMNYRGEMYMAAYCENREKVIDFKLSRMNKYNVLNEQFEIESGFNLKEYMKNCIGIFKGKEYRVKLKIVYPMSQIVREKIWVEDQIISDCEDGGIIFEGLMRGMTEIKSWVLSMGSHVKILEPVEIFEEVKAEIKKMLGNF